MQFDRFNDSPFSSFQSRGWIPRYKKQCSHWMHFTQRYITHHTALHHTSHSATSHITQCYNITYNSLLTCAVTKYGKRLMRRQLRPAVWELILLTALLAGKDLSPNILNTGLTASQDLLFLPRLAPVLTSHPVNGRRLS
jgi:hypothetical protein